MRYHCVFMLSILTAVLLGSLAKPLSSPWDDMHIKHSWNAVQEDWESLGHPPSGTTIDLYVALKPHHENALIDALYEVSSPTHPRHVLHHSFAHVCTYMCHCSSADTVRTCLRSKLLSL